MIMWMSVTRSFSTKLLLITFPACAPQCSRGLGLRRGKTAYPNIVAMRVVFSKRSRAPMLQKSGRNGLLSWQRSQTIYLLTYDIVLTVPVVAVIIYNNESDEDKNQECNDNSKTNDEHYNGSSTHSGKASGRIWKKQFQFTGAAWLSWENYVFFLNQVFILFQYYFSIGFKLFVNRFHNLTMVFIIFSIGFDMFSLVSFSQFLGTISKGVLNSAALLGWFCDDFLLYFSYTWLSREMVVQDEQSIKKSTYICWSGLPKCISSFYHWVFEQFSNLLQLFAIDFKQFSDLFFHRFPAVFSNVFYDV